LKLELKVPEQLVKIVEKLGFVKIRQKGSHIVYRHPDWTMDNNPYA